MNLEWLGQIACPPGTIPDPTGTFCFDPTNPLNVPQVPPVVIPPVIEPPAQMPPPAPTTAEKRDRTLVYAASIVAAGIVAAVLLSRV